MRRRLATILVPLAIALAGAAVPVAPAEAQDQRVPTAWSAEWSATDFSRAAVPFDSILSGGPPKDGIPSIDDPRFVPVAEVTGDAPGALAPTEPVMSLALDGAARAYPLRVLMWHEIVNDRIADVPVAVTYCPLCNAGIVFDRRFPGPDGATIAPTFGTTGKLRHSDLIMYDRATESWWQQYSGEAIVGTMLGTELARIPSRLESIERFAERHPEGRVLVPPRPGARPYGANPYEGYDRAPRPFLYSGRYDGPGGPLMRVVAVEGEAWSLPLLRQRGRIETDDGLILTWTEGQNSALDTRAIARGRDVGNVVVERVANGGRIDVLHDIPFAFAFRAFHPEGVIHHRDP